MKNQYLKLFVIIGTALFFTACASPEFANSNTSNTSKGATLGTLGGAGFGAIVGNNVLGISKTEGAVAGAIVGGLLGGAMGNQRDAMAQQNASVQRRLDALDASNTATVNVQNSNGSMTPVILHKAGAYWIGPRGEQYMNLPGAGQLRPVYGF